MFKRTESVNYLALFYPKSVGIGKYFLNTANHSGKTFLVITTTHLNKCGGVSFGDFQPLFKPTQCFR